jgi:diacylglycerol O-acyltransferase / wax synthase
MELISPIDAGFLLGESREHPMHVGGLQLFEPPEGASPDYLRELFDRVRAQTDFSPTFRKRPATLFGGITNVGWAVDRELDVDYHLRRSALPSPGRVRELLELVSRLHSSLLDRHHPLWEAYFIEGLRDGRFAVYTKMHHSLVDGVSALKLMTRSLSENPNDVDVRVPWALPPRTSKRERGSLVQTVTGAAGSVAGLAPSALKVARAALLDRQLTLPFAAPKTMFNVKIAGARRFAAQSWPLERIKRVKSAAGATVNDVVLAMCSGALRGYLMEHNQLPDSSLIAMVPVSLRSAADADAGGNMVGTVLCNLGTDIDDPAQRLGVVSTSMRGAKELFAQLSRPEAMLLSGLLIAPLTFGVVPGYIRAAPPAFNVVISNVPGPRQPMYTNGARLVGNYPLSIVMDGFALNITLVSNGDNLDFGLIGCRRSVPHLQRLLGHLEDSLSGLEQATGG